jgi:hypothetical protein
MLNAYLPFAYLLVALGFYVFLGCSVLSLILSGLVIKDSDGAFLDYAGDPTAGRVLKVLLSWPLVLAHVLLVRWPLPKREIVYRTVHVQNRLTDHYELEIATRFLGRYYRWQALKWPTGAGWPKGVRKFTDWASAVEAARQLNEKELSQRFKIVRRAGPAFSGNI